MATQPKGLNPDTYKHIVLGTGMVLADIEELKDGNLTAAPTYADIAQLIVDHHSSEHTLGGFRGGVDFVYGMETERVPVDDDTGNAKGLERITGQPCNLSGTMVELREENIRRVIPTSYVNEVHGGMTASRVILDSHYLQNLVSITMYGNGDFCVIRLDNPLQSESTTFSFNEGVDSGTMDFNFSGHTDSTDFAPFYVWRVPMPDGSANPQAVAAAKKALAGGGKFEPTEDK